MSNFQHQKKLILDFYAAFDAQQADMQAELDRVTDADYLWRGYHPFGELNRDQVVSQFWGRFGPPSQGCSAAKIYFSQVRMKWMGSIRHGSCRWAI